MTKTLRLNENDVSVLNSLLSYYNKDFSSLIKGFLYEKMEDISDIEEIMNTEEKNEYVSADYLDSIFLHSSFPTSP